LGVLSQPIWVQIQKRAHEWPEQAGLRVKNVSPFFIQLCLEGDSLEVRSLPYAFR